MSFQFDTKLTLSVEGRNYTVDYGKVNVLAEYEKVYRKAVETQKQTTDEGINEVTKQMVYAAKEFINAVLGASAFDDIFKDRLIDWADVIDLCCYIMTAINSHKMSRVKALEEFGKKYGV